MPQTKTVPDKKEKTQAVPKAAGTRTIETITSLENANRHLLENQTFLYEENQSLQRELAKLKREIDQVRKAAVDPLVLETLKQEKNNLVILNDNLKNKIKQLKLLPSSLGKEEIENERKEKESLSSAIQDLENVLAKIEQQSEKVLMRQRSNEVTEVINLLTNKIEVEEKKSESAAENLRRIRDDGEKYTLRDKVAELKQKITDLEVEITKLRLLNDRLADDAEKSQRDSEAAAEEIRNLNKKSRELENDKDKLKQIINEVEHDNFRLKKEMIEELNEANRAKRVSIDTEIALQHISEAYEMKRKEVSDYIKQLDEANDTIKKLHAEIQETANLNKK